MLASVVLIAPGACRVVLWIAAFAAIGWQTRLEERHLLALHGNVYRRYAGRTGRFLPAVGLLRNPRAEGS
jgi:protein-S-isoprenylcysteine O-methyltransferase Ste14